MKHIALSHALLWAVLLTVGSSHPLAAETFDLFHAGSDSSMVINQEALHQIRAIPVGVSLSIEPVFGTLRLNVARFEVTDFHTRYQLASTDGIRSISAPFSVHLRGSVEGLPGSVVVLSLFDGWGVGRIKLDDNPAATFILAPDSIGSNRLVAIALGQLQPEPWHCATDDDDFVPDERTGKPQESTQALRRIEVALEGDEPYYIDHGRNETVAINYAEAVMAAVSDIYERDAEATIYLNEITIWTTTDPYPGTTSGAMLGEFRSYWIANHAAKNRTLAHLFSGQNGIGGVAYLRGLCNKNIGYAVSGLTNRVTYPRTTYAWDTDVTAHELGHNVGSPHTHNCGWAPPIDSCYTAEGGCFQNTVAIQGTIMSYCHLTNQGKRLDFHPQVQTLMKSRLATASCVQSVQTLFANAGADAEICNGVSTMLAGEIEGGSGPFEISWSPSAGLSATDVLQPTATPTATTTYVLTVTDAFGDVDRDTVVITVNPAVSVSVDPNRDVCEGTVLAVSLGPVGGTPPITFRWTSAELDTVTTDNMLSYVPTQSGALSVVATDSKGCTDEGTMVVSVRPDVEVDIQHDPVTHCPDDVVLMRTSLLGGTPPYTYIWYYGGVPLPDHENLVSLRLDSTAVLKVIVADQFGCRDTAQQTIHVHDVRFHLTNAMISVPALASCETSFESWLTVVNDGVDTLTVAASTTDGIQIASDELPLTLLPNSSQVLSIEITLLDGRSAVDSIRLREANCGRYVSVAVVGEHPVVAASTRAGDNTWLAALDCPLPQERMLEVVVDNATALPITVTKARSRYLKRDLQPSGQTQIAAASSGTVTFVGTVLLPASVAVDTVDVTFTSGSCTGTVVAIVEAPTVDLSIQQPTLVEFDEPVSPALEDVIRTIDVRVNSQDIQQVTVTDVTVTGPFTADLAVGRTLATNVDHPVNIAFQPSKLAKDGVAGGSLSFSVDGCYETADIILQAERIVVGVDEADGPATPMVMNDGLITVDIGMGTIVVTDIAGKVLVTRTADGPVMIDGTGWPAGVYAITLRDSRGGTTRVAVLKP